MIVLSHLDLLLPFVPPFAVSSSSLFQTLPLTLPYFFFAFPDLTLLSVLHRIFHQHQLFALCRRLLFCCHILGALCALISLLHAVKGHSDQTCFIQKQDMNKRSWRLSSPLSPISSTLFEIAHCITYHPPTIGIDA